MGIKAKLLGTSQYDGSLKEKRVVLPVSLSEAYHEGEKLAAMLDLIKGRFFECDIIVSDTLQRYNYLDKHTPEEAYRLAYESGTQWIERNIHYFDTYPLPFRIIRWDECLNFSGFKSTLEKITCAWQNDISLQATLDQDIHTFIERKHTNFNFENHAIHCRNYILEETAVTLSYFVNNHYHFIAYPSRIPRFVESCRTRFVSNESPELIRDLRIYFRKVNKVVG